MTRYDFDLSGLPEAARLKWQARLEQLPPGIRDTLVKKLQGLTAPRIAEILQSNSPVLEKILSRLDPPNDESEAPGMPTRARRSAPPALTAAASGKYYSNTVQRGDGFGLHWAPLLLVMAALGAIAYASGIIRD